MRDRAGKAARFAMGSRKLGVQLALVVFTTNLLLLGVFFGILYEYMGGVLQEKYEEDSQRWFEQAEYNVHSFCQQASLASIRLVADDALRMVARNDPMPDSRRTAYIKQGIDRMKTEMGYCSAIQSVYLFGEKGTILRCERSGGNRTNFFYDRQDMAGSYYDSQLYEEVKEKERGLWWYGGYTDKDLGFLGDNGEEIYYISVVQPLQSHLGQIVINIPMESVLDIFSINGGETREKSYMVDGSNRVIVSEDPEWIGMEKEFPEGSGSREGIFRYEEERQGEKVQILVYSLPELGWSLVKETPVAEVMKERTHLKNILLLACLLGMGASFAVSMCWIRGLVTPLGRLSEAMQKVEGGELGYTLAKMPENEIGVLTRKFNRMSRELKDMFARNRKAEEEKRMYEMRSLRAQINPHLISNTLNTIKWMAIVNQEKGIAESIALLSEFLEPVFKEESPLCTIREEVEYVRKYVAIMNLRSVGGYRLTVDIPERYYDCLVMRFMLQPVIENAILHGCRHRNAGEIRIAMEVCGEDGLVEVSDDGCGLTESTLERLERELAAEEAMDTSSNGEGGIGLVNVNLRLKNQYGRGYGVTIRNGAAQGAVVTLKIRLQSGNSAR